MADTTHGKRSRKANFTDFEVKILLEEIAKDKKLLQSSESTRSVNEKKAKKWEEIAAKVNICGVTNRTATDVKEKWRLLKSTMQKKRRIIPTNYQPMASMVDERFNMNHNSPELFDARLQQLGPDVPDVKFHSNFLYGEHSDMGMPLSAAVSSQHQHISPGCSSSAWGISDRQTEEPTLMVATPVGEEEEEKDNNDVGSDDDDDDDDDEDGDGDNMDSTPGAGTISAEGDGQTQNVPGQRSSSSSHSSFQGTTTSTPNPHSSWTPPVPQGKNPLAVMARTRGKASNKHCTSCSRRQANSDRLLQLRLKKLELQVRRLQDTQTYRKKQELLVRLLEQRVSREASRAKREEARARKAEARARKEEARARREESQAREQDQLQQKVGLELAGLQGTCAKDKEEERVDRGRAEAPSDYSS